MHPMTSTLPGPRLCFGQVRHTRLRPARNAFAYRVYFVRLPLRAIARTSFGTWLFSHNRFNLLSFRDSDHGDGRQPLVDWIDGLLKTEGVDDADGEIWLQTFPRVFGYVFNPVSFWFCHRSDGALRAIVCEVRNTFGERHYYLLDTGAAMQYGIAMNAKKVFHVSPFCPVEGHYRFRFMQTGLDVGDASLERSMARIDYEDASGPLLLTSISGISYPLSDLVAAKAFFGYPLMTFGVIAKIHWQALRLWLKRVPLFTKPAPPSSELSR
jgi:DUF1365 family protein